MLTVKIDAFEGPLDLLLHLIEKAEVDIYDISVAEITNQYIAYIHSMQELELEIASEYLVMAATLLHLKSKMLLPQQEENLEPADVSESDEIQTREELIERLLEYKKYKQVAMKLREKEVERSKIYTRPAENLSMYIQEGEVNPVANISLYHLLDVFYRVLNRRKGAPPAKIERDEVSIEKKMEEITNILARKRHVLFSQLLLDARHKSEVITTFLAILELIKKQLIICHQRKLFDDISIVSCIKDGKHGS